MTVDQQIVLNALYSLEEAELHCNNFDIFFTANEIAQAIPPTNSLYGNITMVRDVLEQLWIQRKVLQIAPESSEFHLVDTEVVDHDSIGDSPSKLPVEQDDIRGLDGHPWERVAIFDHSVDTCYRTRIAEIGRLLSRNHQRFRMLPSTGLLRYERRPQRRPQYQIDIASFRDDIISNLRTGAIQIPTPAYRTERYILKSTVNIDHLCRAVQAALDALISLIEARNMVPYLAEFQARSVLLSLAGLYSSDYRTEKDGHVVTAGVGSGKSYAFQIGALIHAAYCCLNGSEPGVATLLVYPRVVLASNQFQDLRILVRETAQRLGCSIPSPVLDAGGRLGETPTGTTPVRGQMYNSIQEVYQGITPILISNLDTIANRISHPEASEGLTKSLDFIVFDEVHLMSGLYGAHGRMLLKRLILLRSLWKLRRLHPIAAFEKLLKNLEHVDHPYFLGASATIAEPRHHMARIINTTAERIIHLGVEEGYESGWVHHFFLRQRPEASSLTAAINATACLVHNRRDGLYHEYYQRKEGTLPLSLHELENPVLPSNIAEPREPKQIHKTLGFCDSLDGVNRWSDLIADNERTKAQSMNASANPVRSIPYFVRFQEPLWRVVLYSNLSQNPPSWLNLAVQHYGALCHDCKRGVKRSIPRIPAGLRQAQTRAFEQLWDHGSANNKDSFLVKLGVNFDDFGFDCFSHILMASTQHDISNLDSCSFFRAGLCWWWSRDHLGSNRPISVSPTTTLNGYRRPRNSPDGRFIPLNGLRVRSFTSKANLASRIDSINNVYQGEAQQIFRHRNFGDQEENCALIIGSPSIEVGVDLARVRDGITFRAMRDPAGLQQKSGRVGRETASDSVLVHLVSENARDHYYFRNPRIVLDPDYLQPIPLHEDNRIVARNHFFMAIFDFLVLQGNGPPQHLINQDGDRIMLINDHKYKRPFTNWDRKVASVFEFLFGSNPRAVANRNNLSAYIERLGAESIDIEVPGYIDNGPQSAPLATEAGVLDVLKHELGPNFFQTQLSIAGKPLTLAMLAASPFPPPLGMLSGYPRHAEFLGSYHNPTAGIRTRSYARDLLTLPLFRRGVPPFGLPGNQPFLWAPNFFESVGREYVRVFIDHGTFQRELDYEPLTTVLALLVPGTVSYRYDTTPYKVPVSSFGAQGLDTRQKGLQDVLLNISDVDYFQPIPSCPPIQPQDLPSEYPNPYQAVPIYRPKQIGLLLSHSEPTPHPDGLLADNDERDFNTSPLSPMATPPRCFALRWYRLNFSTDQRSPIKDRLSNQYKDPIGNPIPPAPKPPVLNIFGQIEYDKSINVTSFVWGLDRQFMTRSIAPARLVYHSADPQVTGPVGLGHHFNTPGIRFEIHLQSGTPIDIFLTTTLARADSTVYQSLLAHTLFDFLSEHALAPTDPNDPPWADQARPSTFVVRNLRTIIWFHLLEQWYPSSQSVPSNPPRLSLDDLIGCFTPNHPLFIDSNRYHRICRWIAGIQNPASVNDRTDTLLTCRPYFDIACQRISHLNDSFFRLVAERLLLNSLGIALHNSALRVSGALPEDIVYFYRRQPDTASEIVLFDSDEFGNGTADLLQHNFHVSSIERVLSAREAAIGGTPDPLPTTDFVECLEDALQECSSNQASHLAYHNILTSTIGCWRNFEGECQGERQIAGRLFDFFRQELGINSFDHLVIFQCCPEFVAYVSDYPAHSSYNLVGGADYPTFQALESAFGFCVDGCISCLISPEHNIHGVLNARESVSKLLLDAFYREVVCGVNEPITNATYPGTGPARTVEWSQLASTVASSMAQTPSGVSSFTVRLQGISGASDVTVLPATNPGSWNPVFRSGWNSTTNPEPIVRPRMPL